MERTLAIVFFVFFCCIGCGISQEQIRCLDQERYLNSGEVGLIIIPDNLDSPDQSNALQIPQNTETSEISANASFETCTEAPPAFY